MDRPSFMYGSFGTIGCESPLRPYEKSFRDEGMPLYVHSPEDGPVCGSLLDQVRSDVSDLEFLECFQRGVNTSEKFRDLQIAHGNYGQSGTHEDVAKSLGEVNVRTDFAQYDSPMDLLVDDEVRIFEHSTVIGRAKSLISRAAICSTKMNFASDVCKQEGFTPLADALPYQGLLETKYTRAAQALTRAADRRIEITDLCFAIFDELVPREIASAMTPRDAIKYRKETQGAREAFLEQVAALHGKQASIGEGADYAAAVRSIVLNEILPAARDFKNRVDKAYETLLGSMAARAATYASTGAAVLSIFGHMSWPNLIYLAGLAGAAALQEGVKAEVSTRAARRECAVAFLLNLE